MRQRVGPIVKVLVVMCLLACAAGSAAAQDESDLSARQRIFPGVGPGLRTIKRGADGRLYILASPSPGLLVFDAQGKQVLSINETGIASSGTGQRHALITFGGGSSSIEGGFAQFNAVEIHQAVVRIADSTLQANDTGGSGGDDRNGRTSNSPATMRRRCPTCM